MGFEELLFASLGEEKSNRSLFGPGKRNIRALKWDSETGQNVGGNPSSSRLTVRLPSNARVAGSAITPYIDRTF
jgi:hypothetical protein